ncbi:penicillin-binding protein 1A [Luminiphilus syltensis NOR5-1B]|uniref:Penicillin-binding protein 1A n=2 Tax=Luminiphilus TaxID=1341118 RepID=B8KUT4_9GAMM|nr:penicillin-binding protein 1A [Luminiphilus syltensis NOR5-1B]
MAGASLWGLAGLYLYLSPNLPEADTLREVKLQTPMRVFSQDGLLIGQFGEQKRSPLRFDQIPQGFIDALLSAEDDQFFKHSGIDPGGLLRAVSELVLTGEKGSGGSTLTMQVARNYFLSLERTFLRKFNEILLALEIERALTKEEIFELYVNRVFLGHRAYGFEAAAQTYYGRSLWELSLAQQAMLAGIPKAPSRNNPLSNPEKGKARRDWILGRMARLGKLDETQLAEARAEPVTAEYHGLQVQVDADYVAEMVRQEMVDRFGQGAYNDGYVVHTTVDSTLQLAARDALLGGLRTYDARHGWRGPERRLPPPLPLPTPIDESNSEIQEAQEAVAIPEELFDQWQDALRNMPVIADLDPAIVTRISEQGAELLHKNGSMITLAWEGDLEQVRRYLSENSRTARPETIADVLAVGDLVRVTSAGDGSWKLAQVPRAQAALVALDPSDGAIRSLVGGMGFELSKFNRVTQAKRQPGSNFKPFLYAAALESGVTAATLINDAPIVLDNLASDEIWRPENDSGKFYGPTRLRNALTFSRNLVSIRVLQRLGVDRFTDYLDQIGFDTSNMARNLTLALGTHAYTPMDIVSGYAMLANGGYRVEPYLINRIEDARGDIIWQSRPALACQDCDRLREVDSIDADQPLRMEDILNETSTETVNEAPQVMDPRITYIVTSMLQDAIQRGTGRRARVLERQDIAGKTGTTNGPRDAWFSGYNRNLVTTTWVGFDDYSLLGKREFGGTAALPIWIDFMREAAGPTLTPAPMPSGVTRLRIDAKTGERVTGSPKGSMLEYFLEEHLPPSAADGGSSIATDELKGLF